MSYWRINVVVTILFCACLTSCQDKPVEYPMPKEKDNSLDLLADVNKYLTYKDQDIIEGYNKRHNLPMIFNEAGYYSLTLHAGSGAAIETGNQVSFTCKVSLLDGTELYNNTVNDPKTFVVGKTKEIKGLQIGLVGLHEGSRALFIFPPHLAYGLIGDKDKIPSRVNLLYDVEITKVVKK